MSKPPRVVVEVGRTYPAHSPLDSEGVTDVTVLEINMDADTPVYVRTVNGERGFVPLDDFCDRASIASRYKQDSEEDVDASDDEDSDSVYYGPNWKSTREDVIEADGSQCVVCLSEEDLHVHHIKPLRLFDDTATANHPDNLATLCGRCHRRVEVIQDEDKRRGVGSFIAELESEGVDVSKGLLRHLTYNRLTSNPDGSEMCPHDGCFYPVESDYTTCASCGGHLIWSEDGLAMFWPEIYVVKCKDCDYHDVYRQDDPDIGWDSDNWDAEVAAQASRDNHRASEFRDYEEGKRHRPFVERVCDDTPCDCRGFTPSSKDQAIDHLVRKHDLSRIEARKEVSGYE